MLYHNSALPTDSLLISPYDSLPFFSKFRDYFTLLFFKCQSFLFFLTITLFDNFLSIFSYLSFFICPKFSHFPPVLYTFSLTCWKFAQIICVFQKNFSRYAYCFRQYDIDMAAIHHWVWLFLPKPVN